MTRPWRECECGAELVVLRPAGEAQTAPEVRWCPACGRLQLARWGLYGSALRARYQGTERGADVVHLTPDHAR